MAHTGAICNEKRLWWVHSYGRWKAAIAFFFKWVTKEIPGIRKKITSTNEDVDFESEEKKNKKESGILI